MSKKNYTSGEKKSFMKGFFFGLFRSKRKKSSAPMKKHCFSAFNENCDVFNVCSYGRTRSEALKNARKNLKVDPEEPTWRVTIGNGQPDPGAYRMVIVGKDGSINDNWKPYYRH